MRKKHRVNASETWRTPQDHATPLKSIVEQAMWEHKTARPTHRRMSHTLQLGRGKGWLVVVALVVLVYRWFCVALRDGRQSNPGSIRMDVLKRRVYGIESSTCDFERSRGRPCRLLCKSHEMSGIVPSPV